jgi:putative ABC transport system substrate-binding protein
MGGRLSSLARPGGNVTGLSSGITESYPKRVELLGELLPKLKRIAAILNMGNPSPPTSLSNSRLCGSSSSTSKLPRRWG